MTLVVLRGKSIRGTRKFPARIKQQPIAHAGQVPIHVPIRPPTHSDTFIKPDNPSFRPLILPTLTPQQNYFNALPDPEVNLSFDIDSGLPLNPFKRTNYRNSGSH